MFQFARFIAFAALLLCASYARAVTLHVALAELPEVPADAQFRTISDAAKVAQAGDTVTIHGGTYRESVKIDKSGTRAQPIRFQSAPGARVVVTGADQLDAWNKVPDTGADNVFVADWNHRFINWSPTMAHPNDDYHLLIGRGEQVSFNGYALRQVLSRDKLARGTFFADVENKKLYVQADNNSADIGKAPPWAPRIEATARENVWDCSGDYVDVRGLTFSMCANSAQNGMARFSGKFDGVSDCIFQNSNGTGAQFGGTDINVLRCTFQDNGQLGWRAERAHRLRMTDCLTTRNNTKNFARGWEAGGDKIVLTRDMTIENSRFIANRGIGIWFDIGNENCTVANCLIADNEDAGIFYEISYGLHARDNVIVGNGFTDDAYAWGASGGIAVSSSPDCEIERNLLIGNREGFQFRGANRTTPRIDAPEKSPEEAVWNHDENVHNNVFALNRNAGVGGWFDVDDERLWPRAMQEKSADAAKAPGDVAASYVAADKTKIPPNLSLETLNLKFASNLYAPGDNGGLFNWGTEWKHHQNYRDLTAVQTELKLENGSAIAPFEVANYLTLDLRVPADSLALKMKCYPQGEVPGVKLGVLPQRNG